MHYLTKPNQQTLRFLCTKYGKLNVVRARAFSTAPYSQELNAWKTKSLGKKIRATDKITASQINLLGNTLNHSKFNYDQLPSNGTVIPQGWHLAFFPVRVPEKELSKEGYHKDWSPPGPYTHRVWAGGKVEWNVENPLRVGDEIQMEASLSDAKQEDDAIFVWVKRSIHNQHGLALSESRCCIYTEKHQMRLKDVSRITDQKSTSHEILSNPEFTFCTNPSAITLFRFSALTFNAHRIHYDRAYATEIEKQRGESKKRNRRVKSVEYRCLNPLPVNETATICGRWKTDEGSDLSYDLWIVDSNGEIAVKGIATIDDAK
ncbi:hypothetical protein G6F56_008483 [Rhizopus delemar]|nr:hypothetical protein G6F56_008483 [Rhizopus delemar]